MIYTESFNEALASALDLAKRYRHEYVTPEHVLCALLTQEPFCIALEQCMGSSVELENLINEYLEDVEKVPMEMEYSQALSFQINEMINHAYKIIRNSDIEKMTIPHIVQAMFNLRESSAANILKYVIKENTTEFIGELITQYECYEEMEEIDEELQSENRKKYVTCLNEKTKERNPLIGRDIELERTIQVLCRKEKNNPLYIGESGVGKTTMVYGLAARIETGNIPEKLSGYKIYEIDTGAILSGTQFRGDFEKRVKNTMDELCKESKAIVYIDDLHNIIGLGKSGDVSMDIFNLLKPYFDRNDIRFMGSVTYEDYNKYLSNRTAARYFQQIDIKEPNIEECIEILNGLKKRYEDFHEVKYSNEVIEFIVKASVRFINDRYLPDKAIDLMDESGSYYILHKKGKGKRLIDKSLVMTVLSGMCKINSVVTDFNDNSALATLHTRISSQIYGQEEAVTQVVKTIQMAKAGLLDENRPLASFLFIGPTGVGKTELAKVLSIELGVPLQRYDMSEYAEKHTVAKLIGSPAGYVGYEDGGLLTDGIRKTPYCILLLDEIEKAHSDIFNILLQVMDYAVLTDNKGRKSDFRHVILIMTSNAGAQYARQSSIGFGNKTDTGESMLKQVKKIFKPEFINRLTNCMIFHEMDKNMALSVLDKKLRELEDKLKSKNITMRLDDTAKKWILEKGFTVEYGAREMERVITSELKPILTEEILFGKLKNGGNVEIKLTGNRLTVY